MKTTKKNKPFDAVKMMRDVSDKVSIETQNMSLEVLKNYIKTRLILL
jgi:hypothetical protein